MRASRPIFITGGAGFIGSYLVERLVRDGHRVALLARPTTDLANLTGVRHAIEIFNGDITDQKRIAELVTSLKPKGFFHLAVSTILAGKTAPDNEVIRTNVHGTVNLINAAGSVDYDFFIQTGSYLEYGPKDHSVREDELCAPGELYSISKLAGTLYGQAIARSQNKPIVTFRVFTPYGPRSQKGRFVEVLVARALAGEDLKLSKPEVTRDFIYVEDLVDLLVEGMEKAKGLGGKIFNAGGGRAISFGDLVSLVLKQTNSKSGAHWNAFAGAAYDSDFCQADMRKTHEAFLWRPKHTLAEGIEKTVEWCRSGIADNSHKNHA
ncbi:MAG: NAD(P)-dependent oxidoreductase [bacterium]|nr:NAD(P)-dependent oxidoreductase [bacterium]